MRLQVNAKEFYSFLWQCEISWVEYFYAISFPCNDSQFSRNSDIRRKCVRTVAAACLITDALTFAQARFRIFVIFVWNDITVIIAAIVDVAHHPIDIARINIATISTATYHIPSNRGKLFLPTTSDLRTYT